MAAYFKQLNYTLGDEDPSPEMHILPPNSRHVMAVADCGSRVLPLLCKAPAALTCVDINAQQLAVCEMRLALLRACTLEEYRAFLGYQEQMSPARRKEIFSTLQIDARRKELLQQMFEDIGWHSMLYLGKFEKMLQTLARVVRLIAGRKAIDILQCRTLDEQRRYYRERFPHRRWALVLALLGNSTALNSLLYKGDFPKKNIPGSHFSIYHRIFEQLFTEQLARDSFFLQMILLGRIEFAAGNLIECQPEIFAAAKQHLPHCQLNFVEGDVFSTVGAAQGVDFVSLSDVPSFMTADDEYTYLEQIRSGLLQGAIIAVRAHLRAIVPQTSGFANISTRYQAITARESSRLWSFHLFQYGQH